MTRVVGVLLLLSLATSAPRTSAGLPAPARVGGPDLRGMARALADSLRVYGVCAVSAAPFSYGAAARHSGDRLPAFLARALAVPLAPPGTVAACAQPGAGARGGTQVDAALVAVAAGGREARVDVGFGAQGWTYRLVRRRAARWRVAGRVGRRWSA